MTKTKTVLTKSTTPRTQPKDKLSRRLGENLWGITKAAVVKRPTGPGQHGARRKKLTDFGIQLREKQKLKGYYANMGERQFRGVFAEAIRRKGDTSENLIGLLESRLDAVVYRLNLVPTMHMARQVISHKHILVNGKVLNIASYRCMPGDTIELREKARSIPAIMGSVASIERQVPEYLTFDPSAFKGTFVRLPVLDDVPYPVQMNPNLVVEFYSR
ncbi:MAG: 30S ribosomal protein S4 [Alphaproteobacteria bacterium CG_4_10_14_0_8_um_filter_53_9]|nr:MAG: 30S ribosomal protein S4 [Alphaproteobacteria bacterium CG_4_10_14_0_8_um_filter_53_9]